ncbi:MAG: SurA N-terminal domain-containing protein [Deltaproteobacteria bacterium]|nr:SurA N-terminal domain-containing protein [Deltaproteobacteria bacterium]
MAKFLQTGLKFVLVIIGTAILLVLGLFLVEEHYKKQLWDPELAALVNGRPITRDEVEQVLKIGSHPPLAAELEAPGSLSIAFILEKLIDEELLRQAAEREGLAVSEEEVNEFLRDIRRSWGCSEDDADSFRCQLPKGEDLASLKEAIEEQLLLNRMASLVSSTHGRRTKKEWDDYLEKWTIAHALPTIFRARAILVDKTSEAKELVLEILNAEGNAYVENLEDLEDRLNEAGYSFVLSSILYLDPRGPVVGIIDPEELARELNNAANGPRPLTSVLELKESYAVIEILEVIEPLSPEELAHAARGSYESQVRDQAFRDFIDKLRAEAVIEINPNFQDAATPVGQLERATMAPEELPQVP